MGEEICVRGVCECVRGVCVCVRGALSSYDIRYKGSILYLAAISRHG